MLDHVLLVALFTSSCHWAPTPLDIPSHALESIYPSLATSRPTLDLHSLLNASAPTPTPTDAAPTSRVTYSARLERPKRCWCTPYNIFEPFNTTRWDQRATVLVFVKQGFWDWLVDQETELDQATGATDPQQAADTEQPTSALPTPTAPTHTSWRTKWNALSSYFSSRPTEQKDNATPKHRPEGRLKSPVRAPLDSISKPTPTSTPTATATATGGPTEILAVPAGKGQDHLPWWKKQYDLRPHGGGVVVDFKWGRG